jgi:hypothetical protein
VTLVALAAQGSRPETQMTYSRLSSGVETHSQISSMMTTFSAEASAVRGKNKDSQRRLNRRVASDSEVVSEVVSSKMMMTISLDEASEEAACSNKCKWEVDLAVFSHFHQVRFQAVQARSRYRLSHTWRMAAW